MHQMQRGLLIVVVLMVFGATIVLPDLECAAKLQEQWEILQTEQFMKGICRNKECSYEAYALLQGALNYSGTSSDIEVEEYQKEQDMAGNEYYYGISWSEIQENLFCEGKHCFNDDSIIVICVNRHSRSGNVKNKYYDIVSGKD